VAQIVHSARALDNLARSLESLHSEDPETALAAGEAVESAINTLASHPLVGRRVEGDIRELVISFGATGYIALYRFVVQQDEVRVLALRQQREIGYLP
jgi:plasmid stabilization system protein ParE